eukprot:TRINITY_DN2650_c0_g1_i1.p1 TRINITY_DN2650_c0_g1~~TRINITY_DN2650_c0_g1_i1.p1  ORF type:complete len:745 (-),score=230.49 TRINITY_DN2650_c0_g1_i1:1000-3093(-)
MHKTHRLYTPLLLAGALLLLVCCATPAAAADQDQCEADLSHMPARSGKNRYPNATRMLAATGAGDYGWNNYFSKPSWSRVDPGLWRACERLDDVARYCFIRNSDTTDTVGACVPKSCDAAAIMALNTTFVVDMMDLPSESFSHGTLFADCSEAETSLPVGGILVVTFIGLLVLLVVLAGILEALMHMRPQWFDRDYQGPEYAPIHRSRDDSTSSTGSQYEYDVDYERAQPEDVIGINEVTAAKSAKELRESQPFYIKLLLAFAPMYNFERLMSVPPGNQHLRPLNFLRVLSISMVILGHSFYFWTSIGVTDIESVESFVKSIGFQPLIALTYSVDQFLMLGGLLVAYLFLKTAATSRVNFMTWFMYYFHRVFRLTPAMMMALLVWWQVAPYLGSGPFWPYQQSNILEQCDNYWFSNLLYINNLYPEKIGKSCFGWGWYLAVDMQYYVITPIFLIVYMKHRLAGALLVAVLLFAVWTLCVVLAAVYHLSANHFFDALGHGEFLNANSTYGDYQNLIYFEPWSRAGPYFIGILLAFYLDAKQDRVRMSRTVRYVGYTVSIALLVFISLMTYTEVNYGWGTVADVLNVAYTRSAWCAAMAFLFLAAISGYAKWFRQFASLYVWVPLARLTYAAYLYHPIMYTLYYGTQEVIPMITPIVNFNAFFGFWVLSFTVSFINYLLLEKPMMNLETLLLSIGKKKR